MKNDDSTYQRYQRQLILPDFGLETQQKLAAARVLVIGAGGLGCPVLMVLVGAGVGTVGIVDDGLVELSNLHRQFLYRTADTGKPKVECAARVLRDMNPDVNIVTYQQRVEAGNAWELLGNYDIIIDGTDNFPTRYLINDACVLLSKKLIYGAVSRYDGQVAVFDEEINYRDIFPEPPADGEVANCNEAGVLGVLPGIIGHFMANECIKLIRESKDVLLGKLMTYSSVDNRSFIMALSATEAGQRAMPGSREELEAMNYPVLCGVSGELEIDYEALQQMMEDDQVVIVDVRELHETPVISNLKHIRVPLSTFPDGIKRIPLGNIVFVCQSGQRSLQAVNAFSKISPRHSSVYSLKGGVNSINNINHKIIS